MRKKAAITGGIAAAVLGGGLMLALNDGGTASAERTAATPARPPAAASPSATSIGRAEAERIALTAVPGGQVRSAELETEHGAPVWSVRVVKAGVTHDLDIDARTGKVIRDRDDRRARHPEAEPRPRRRRRPRAAWRGRGSPRRRRRSPGSRRLTQWDDGPAARTRRARLCASTEGFAAFWQQRVSNRPRPNYPAGANELRRRVCKPVSRSRGGIRRRAA